MQYIADLHIHSRYSRATARDLDIAGLHKGAIIKGIDIIGTGDFTFPAYVKEMEENLEAIGGGLYQFISRDEALPRLYGRESDPKFLITTEISNIYKRGGKVRRIHTLILAPGLEEVKELNKQLDKIGNIKSDGRPILGMDAADMAELIWKVSPDFIIIPAHAWTPWFAIFGSKSGFDSIEECFGDLTPRIFAIETGLSSDPLMNWRLSQLDNISLVSNSDAHSLPNLGREATVFELAKLSIKNIENALNKNTTPTPPQRGGDIANDTLSSKRRGLEDNPLLSKEGAGGGSAGDRIAYTIEFYPQEGKYHWDGHRDCKVAMAPEETKKRKGICPKCGRSLTLGVDYRVSELADRAEPKNNGEYKYIVPLQEIIADSIGQAKGTKRAQEIYQRMTREIGNEFAVLLKIPITEIESFGLPELAEGVRRVRAGEIHIEPGYDGQYGVVKVFKPDEQVSHLSRQKTLF